MTKLELLKLIGDVITAMDTAIGDMLPSDPNQRRLQDLGPREPSFHVATRVGPFGKAFVLPDQVLSATEENFQTWFDDGLADYLSWARFLSLVLPFWCMRQ